MIALFSVLGIPVRMHGAFPVLMVFLILWGRGPMLLIMLLSLTLHEAAHALMARMLGQRFESIEIMPFGGVAQMDTALSLRPAQELAIALAGPGCSLIIALFVAASGRHSPFFLHMFQANLSLGFINLLPALPLDGGRALRAACTGRWGRAFATKVFVGMGVLCGGLFILLGFVAAFLGAINPLFFLLGAYLVYAALKEKETLAAACLEALHGRHARLKREGILPVKWLAAEKGIPPERMAARLTAGSYHLFIQVDERQSRVTTLDEGEVLRQVLAKRIGP